MVQPWPQQLDSAAGQIDVGPRGVTYTAAAAFCLARFLRRAEERELKEGACTLCVCERENQKRSWKAHCASVRPRQQRTNKINPADYERAVVPGDHVKCHFLSAVIISSIQHQHTHTYGRSSLLGFFILNIVSHSTNQHTVCDHVFHLANLIAHKPIKKLKIINAPWWKFLPSGPCRCEKSQLSFFRHF